MINKWLIKYLFRKKIIISNYFLINKKRIDLIKKRLNYFIFTAKLGSEESCNIHFEEKEERDKIGVLLYNFGIVKQYF